MKYTKASTKELIEYSLRLQDHYMMSGDKKSLDKYGDVCKELATRDDIEPNTPEELK